MVIKRCLISWTSLEAMMKALNFYKRKALNYKWFYSCHLKIYSVNSSYQSAINFWSFNNFLFTQDNLSSIRLVCYLLGFLSPEYRKVIVSEAVNYLCLFQSSPLLLIFTNLCLIWYKANWYELGVESNRNKKLWKPVFKALIFA